jgi:hypothetical protein
LNPTFTYAPSAVTKIQLSYEYFHDQRTTDRVTFSTTSASNTALGRCRLNVRITPVGSTGRRNTGVKSLCWGFKLQGLTWSFV